MASSGEHTPEQEANLELARGGLEDWIAGNQEATIATFTDDVEVFVPPELGNAGTYTGIEQFRSWFAAWDDAWSEFEMEVEDIEPVGERHVVAMIQSRGVGAGSGIEVEQPARLGARHPRREDGVPLAPARPRGRARARAASGKRPSSSRAGRGRARAAGPRRASVCGGDLRPACSGDDDHAVGREAGELVLERLGQVTVPERPADGEPGRDQGTGRAREPVLGRLAGAVGRRGPAVDLPSADRDDHAHVVGVAGDLRHPSGGLGRDLGAGHHQHAALGIAPRRHLDRPIGLRPRGADHQRQHGAPRRPPGRCPCRGS